MRNFQEQVKKAFCYQKLCWPFIVWINCSSDLKILEILGLQPRFFLTVGQNNFGNKIPLFTVSAKILTYFSTQQYCHIKFLLQIPLKWWTKQLSTCFKNWKFNNLIYFIMQLMLLRQVRAEKQPLLAEALQISKPKSEFY